MPTSKLRTRNNGFKFDQFKFRREIGRNWFTNRVVDEWNKLNRNYESRHDRYFQAWAR